MKKVVALLLVLIFVFTSCANKKEKSEVNNQLSSTPSNEANIAEPTESASAPESTDEGTTKPIERKKKSGIVQVSMCNDSVGCSTEDGYYYIGQEWEDDGSARYYSIYYIDYKTKQESYLCKDKNCDHRKSSCKGSISKEIEDGRGLLFAIENKLYLLVNCVERDGDLAMTDENSNVVELSKKVPVLYCMDLDGANRRVVYEFESGETVSDKIYYDGENLLMEVDKLSVEPASNDYSYVSADSREIIKLSLNDYKRSTLVKPDKDIKLVGCTSNSLILAKEEFGAKYSKAKMHVDRALWAEGMKTEIISFFKYDPKTKKQSNIKQITEDGVKTYAIANDAIYYGVEDSGEIKAVDIENGSERVIGETDYEYIVGYTDELLILESCKLYIQEGAFVMNLQSGETKEMKLLNDEYGAASILACTGMQYLVIDGIKDEMLPSYSFININEYIDQVATHDRIKRNSLGYIINFSGIGEGRR